MTEIKPYLKLLDVYYGSKCNLSCHQCDTNSDITATTEHDPDLQNIFESIDCARQKFDIDLYGMIGGEPLLYLDKINSIIAYIRQVAPDSKIQLSTNGLLLDKKIHEVYALMSEYDCNIFISNHFAGYDKKITQKILDSVTRLSNMLGMKEHDSTFFLKDFLGLENQRNDKNFQNWIDQRQQHFFTKQSGELLYRNQKVFLHYRPQLDFQMHYTMRDGKHKPFQSGDQDLSYLKGCSSPICNFLIDKKIYKCAALGTLHRFLNYHNLLSDQDWKKYIDYKYLDLINCSQDDIENFSKTKFTAIPECDMCGVQTFARERKDVINVYRR